MQNNFIISVPSFSINDEDGRTYYLIQVIHNTQQWTTKKRYNDFKQLRDSLIQYFGDIIPELPKKKYITFLVGKTNEEIDQRRIALENFLQHLLTDERIINSGQFQGFIGKSLNKINVTTLNFKSGIRDFFYSEDLLIILNAETNPLSRFDAYIQNIIDEEAIIPVGSVECWEQSKKSWCKKYNSQAICLYFHNSSLLVGLDNGIINLITILPGKIDSSFEIEQHTSRVMGVYMFNQQIYSISKDQRYRVLNFQTSELLVDYHHINELTCFQFCEVRNCSFIGDRNGQILIFKCDQKLATIETYCQFLRDLAVDPIKNYLIALNYQDGQTLVFNIGSSGNEKNTEQITSFKNKDKSRCLCWSSSRGEVFIGNANGELTIWRAKDRSPIKEYKVHENEITKMIWNEESQTLMTASKDKTIKLICLPSQWEGALTIVKQNKSLDNLDQWQELL